MVNKIILEKLKEREDIGTLLTILYGIEKKCHPKLFRHCAEETRFLTERRLIEDVDGSPQLVHPWESDEGLVVRQANPKPTLHKVESWIDEWLALFPKDLKSKGILLYSVSGNRQACIQRMNKFVATYKYDKELIILATRLYLQEQRAQSWQFTKKNSKFIYDSEGSVLEEYCERVKNMSGENAPPVQSGHFRI